MHTDAGASGRHHLRQACQRQIRHTLKEIGDFGLFITHIRMDHHDLRTAGHKHIQYPALLMSGIFAV